MRLTLDENLDHSAYDALVRAGHDVTTVTGQAMSGAVDRRIMEACRLRLAAW